MSVDDTERYREFISKLQRVDQRPVALNDIKNLFGFKPTGEVVPVIRNVGISELLQCLNDPDKNNMNLACEVVQMCFEKFEPGDVIKHFTGHVMYLLRHEKECVRLIGLCEIYKCLTRDPKLLPVPQYIDLFVAAGQMVSDPHVSVANKAILITSNLPFEAYSKVLDEMKIALEYSASSKCNAYEVVVNISCKSVELFNLCTNLGYIDSMVSELNSNDVLYQMNILELLSNLAVKPYGINYLVQNKALKYISELVADMSNNSMKEILIPGYMKFFGCVAHYYPKEILDEYPVFIDALFHAFENDDSTIFSLDTLGFVGTTIEGKLSLAATGSRFIKAVEKVAHLIKNSTTDTKVRALHCFASLISIENDPKVKSGQVDYRVTLMTREWFRTLSTNSMETLFEICKNPFPEIKLAAYCLLDAVCQHHWGQELVARVAGFVEYLLDRSIDQTKDSKEAKYGILKRLAQSDVFDSNINEKIQCYVQQGPFYSETTLEVAMEEGN